MAQVPDYQRQKVYDGESLAFAIDTPTMVHLDEVVAYKDKVLATEYWAANKGWKKVAVGNGQARGRACYKSSKKQICMPKWTRSEIQIIHELAHALTHKTAANATGHGTFFTSHYLNLVEELLGRPAAEGLATGFKKTKAKWNEKLWS